MDDFDHFSLFIIHYSLSLIQYSVSIIHYQLSIFHIPFSIIHNPLFIISPSPDPEAFHLLSTASFILSDLLTDLILYLLSNIQYRSINRELISLIIYFKTQSKNEDAPKHKVVLQLRLGSAGYPPAPSGCRKRRGRFWRR